MKKTWRGGVQKMSKYLRKNYFSGSILERANYKKNKIKPYKAYGSLIERKIDDMDNHSLWEKIKKIIRK